MRRLRVRLARWLMGGALFVLPKTGSWLVHYDAEQDFMFGIPIAEWTGELRTSLEPLDYTTTEAIDFNAPRTTGSFSGTFSA